MEELYLKLWDNGNGLGKNTIKYIKSTLSSALQEALKDKLVYRNEAQLSTISNKIPASRFKYVIYTPDQILKLLSITKGTPNQAAIALAGITGCRRGEVLGLKYSKLDLVNGTIDIEKQLIYEDKEFHYKDVKSGSYRGLYMPKKVWDLLLENKNMQERNKAFWGDDYNNSDYVITKEDGSIFKPGSFSKSFSKILSKNNLPHIRFHDLRHSINSIMAALDIGKEERKAMTGHRSDLADETYTHIFDSKKKQTAEKIDKAFSTDN